MKPTTLSLMIMASFTLVCPLCAQADDVGANLGLVSARPTLGSIDCLRPSGIMSPACPHEIGSPYSNQNNTPIDVGMYRVLRLLASERLHERFHFLKPHRHDQRFALHGFSTNLVMGYPGANMDLNLQDLGVDWRLLGGAVRPFNNEDPYAVVQFSWRW